MIRLMSVHLFDIYLDINFQICKVQYSYIGMHQDFVLGSRTSCHVQYQGTTLKTRNDVRLTDPLHQTGHLQPADSRCANVDPLKLP